jgi:NADH-quinone oxidoreductase subunit F
VTIDQLFERGFAAIFLALGSHKSLSIGLEGEDADGVIPSIQFLKAFNMRGEMLARGHVGIIGGGNSAVDAARMAIRQRSVESVTIYYRRTREEMPAFQEEIDAAEEEGVRLELLVTPTGILTEDGKLVGLRCQRNRLGGMDKSGRRRPVPIEGSEFEALLDTLIVAISESSDTDCLSVAASSKVETSWGGRISVDPETLLTSRPGVFAGGDVVTGPNTVVDAIAAGKRAAALIERHVLGEELALPRQADLPEEYIEPLEVAEEEIPAGRPEVPTAPVSWRRRGFAEVEMSLSDEEAMREACRCLRCDLRFTQPESQRGKDLVREGERS